MGLTILTILHRVTLNSYTHSHINTKLYNIIMLFCALKMHYFKTPTKTTKYLNYRHIPESQMPLFTIR